MSGNKAEYMRDYRRKRLAADPDYRNREAREWRARHPDVSKSIKARHRERNLEAVRADDRVRARVRRENPAVRALHRQRVKLSRDASLFKQAGRPRPDLCELCGEPPQGGHRRELVFDHCHLRGVFRGWLCDRCNRTLGQVKDSPALLRAMANYLERHNGATEGEAT